MSQATTTDGDACNEEKYEDAQRWPTPNDSSFPCTQHSRVSNSQVNLREELESVEQSLEKMGYTRPFPFPLPGKAESMFPLPEGTQDAQIVQERMKMLASEKDEAWSALEELSRNTEDVNSQLFDVQNNTAIYMDYLERIRSGEIKPVHARSYRQEGNKLAGMRMDLLEMLAEESIRKRPRFDD